ncbi:hypothetical protein B0I35DRAFT_434255 [Stachybotrys elegans]|uniref:Uncharacterized protein n=1 Tax=Stachybotrys elegans TaxID=80388 RepID=A0A8K0SNT7_9HYPO|nr:hypothetical protein B0I35DRAFT_434255 [Stachybotrys elegans]
MNSILRGSVSDHSLRFRITHGIYSSIILLVALPYLHEPSSSKHLPMIFQYVSIQFMALFAIFLTANAQQPNCVYQEYACGYVLAGRGYSTTSLRAAIEQLPAGVIPPTLTDVQLLQTLYGCRDTHNTIVGNAYCMSGCIAMGGYLERDQCAMPYHLPSCAA